MLGYLSLGLGIGACPKDVRSVWPLSSPFMLLGAATWRVFEGSPHSCMPMPPNAALTTLMYYLHLPTTLLLL